MADSLCEMRLSGIMVVILTKTNNQTKLMNTTTMILCRRISKRRLFINPPSPNIPLLVPKPQTNPSYPCFAQLLAFLVTSPLSLCSFKAYSKCVDMPDSCLHTSSRFVSFIDLVVFISAP